MARNTLYDYSATASDNTDIAGINIAEGWLAADVNNALRALLAQVATYITGLVGVIKATASQIWTATDDTKVFTPKNAADSAAWIALADSATIAIDANTGINFTVTLGGNRSIGNPTNLKPGYPLNIEIVQPATGGPFTVTWGTSFDFDNATAPILSTLAGAKDLFSGVVRTSTSVYGALGRNKG